MVILWYLDCTMSTLLRTGGKPPRKRPEAKPTAGGYLLPASCPKRLSADGWMWFPVEAKDYEKVAAYNWKYDSLEGRDSGRISTKIGTITTGKTVVRLADVIEMKGILGVSKVAGELEWRDPQTHREHPEPKYLDDGSMMVAASCLEKYSPDRWKWFRIDQADYKVVNKYKWCYFVKKGKRFGYVQTTVDRRTLELHMLLMGRQDNLEIDHIKGETDGAKNLDNRRCNLRFGTHRQNTQNHIKRIDVTSKYKGVSWDKRRDKWKANIAGKELGRYDDERAAASAYNAAALRMTDGFFWLNEVPKD